MTRLTFNNTSYTCSENETVLDVLHGHGITVPSSCRSGLCQTCLMQSLKGKPPAAAQKGLKDTLKAQNYFLACCCHPNEDLEVSLPNKETARIKATVNSIEKLCGDIVGVSLQCDPPLEYKSGQFINLFKEDSLVRSYSIASVPEQDNHIKLHVRKVPDGRMSSWIHHELNSGDSVEISQAVGDCFYTNGQAEQPMLLIGTGSGLAPLYGIARDAIKQGHKGPIKLYHGSINLDGLYLRKELEELSQKHENFSYVPCVSDEPVEDDNIVNGQVLDVALQDHSMLAGWRIFLCGNPNMIKAAKKKTFLIGAAMKDIYADAFAPAATK